MQFGTKAASLRTAVEAFAATAARQSAVITGAALDKETITYPGGFTRILDRNTPSLGRPTGWQLGMADTNGALASAGVETAATYGYSETTGRLETVSGNSSGTFTYGYETNSSLIKTLTRPGLLETQPALRVTNTWEPARDVLLTKANERVLGETTTDVCSITYTVNALGQRTHATRTGAATNGTEWGYDTLGQLETADDTTPAADRAYQYDTIGNRLTRSVGVPPTSTATYTPNALNQYDAITEGTVTFTPTHDDDGNQKNAQIQALGEQNTASCIYHWDAENRLTSVTSPTGEVLVSYTYDAQSRLISRSVGVPPTTSTTYLYDGWNRIAEYQLQNSSFNLHTSYLWGLDLSGGFQGAGGVGGLLSVNRIGSPLAYPAYDGNGNITEYLGADGTALAHFEYDPFGNTVASTDTTNQFAYRFSTKPQDPATGLYYYGYRWYDPLTGRWPSRDPIEENGGLNLYGFVDSDAVGNLDYLGAEKRKKASPPQPIPVERRPCMMAIMKDFLSNQEVQWDEVFEACGGEVATRAKNDPASYREMSCALRVCMVLNSAGFKISRNGKGYLKAGDGTWVTLDATLLRNHLATFWGNPDVEISNANDGSELTKATSGKCGIAAYFPRDTTRPLRQVQSYHIGFFRDGQKYKDDYGHTDGPVQLWYVPCECPKKLEVKCKVCQDDTGSGKDSSAEQKR